MHRSPKQTGQSPELLDDPLDEEPDELLEPLEEDELLELPEDELLEDELLEDELLELLEDELLEDELLELLEDELLEQSQCPIWITSQPSVSANRLQ